MPIVRLVDVGHCEVVGILALVLVGGRLGRLALEQLLPVRVQMELGDFYLGGVDANHDVGTCRHEAKAW